MNDEFSMTLLDRIEPLIKQWNDEAEKLDEQVKRLKAVRDMVAKESVEPEITWRFIQSTTWRRCAISLGMQINAQKHQNQMAESDKKRMMLELKLQGRESEIDPTTLG